jgi:para-aminobenzoate synthetase component 1
MANPLPLPYDAATRCADRYAWFEALRPLGWAVFLDSGDPARSGGRYDILAAGPRAIAVAPREPFAAARRLLSGEAASDATAQWPVSGGVIGYFGYEAGREAAGLSPDKAGTAPFMPDVALGLYAWTVVVDHAAQRAAITSLASVGEDEVLALRERLLEAREGVPRAFCVTRTCRARSACSTTSPPATATRPTSRASSTRRARAIPGSSTGGCTM